MSGGAWPLTVSGPLAPYADGYVSWLLARGFTPPAVGRRVWQLDHLGRWLEREGFAEGELTPERVQEFLVARRAAGYLTWVSPLSMRLPLAYLREIGVVPPTPAVVSVGQLEWLLADYCLYLARERGLVNVTIGQYERVARLFLEERARAGGLQLERLSAGDVSAFLARECPRRSIAGARRLVAGLRPLLRYLHVAGLIGAPLPWAVPGVADLRDHNLARGLESVVLAKLLSSCDRRRTVGRRDYAILLLLARLGLRAGEVAALELDDVDWRRGELVIRGKGGRRDRLPLPVDVGRALASYLRRRSRAEGSRKVFLKVLAPSGPLDSSGARDVVSEACRRAGVPRVGAHRLRHTAATAMLRRGASLPEIAQVLRHRQLKTTAIYAKVDRRSLRALARPWPGGAA